MFRCVQAQMLGGGFWAEDSTTHKTRTTPPAVSQLSHLIHCMRRFCWPSTHPHQESRQPPPAPSSDPPSAQHPTPPQDFEMRNTEHANNTTMIPSSDALNFAFSLRASYVRSSVKHALKCTLSRHPTFVSCGGILARTSMQARTKPRKQTQSL